MEPLQQFKIGCNGNTANSVGLNGKDRTVLCPKPSVWPKYAAVHGMLH
jgi:hypothetical protein